MPLETQRTNRQSPKSPGTTSSSGDKSEVSSEDQALAAAGAKTASQVSWLPRVPSSNIFARRSRQVRSTIFPILAARRCVRHQDASHRRCPLASRQFLSGLLRSGSVPRRRQTPPQLASRSYRHRRNRAPCDRCSPRDISAKHRIHFQEQTFATFCRGFQETTPLELARIQQSSVRH